MLSPRAGARSGNKNVVFGVAARLLGVLMLLFLVVVAAVGAVMAYAIAWVPVLLLGILLFLSVLIYAVPSSGVLVALGSGALSVVTLQVSYAVAGFLFNRSGRVAAPSNVFRRTKHVHSKE